MNAPDVQAELGVEEDGPTELIVDDGRSKPELLAHQRHRPVHPHRDPEHLGGRPPARSPLRARGRIQAELLRRQQELRAPRSTFIGTADVVPPSPPEASITPKLTAAGTGLGATLFAGFGIAYAVARLRAGRAARARERSAPPPSRRPRPARHAGGGACRGCRAGQDRAGRRPASRASAGAAGRAGARAAGPPRHPPPATGGRRDAGRRPRRRGADAAAGGDEATAPLRARRAERNGTADRPAANGAEPPSRRRR